MRKIGHFQEITRDRQEGCASTPWSKDRCWGLEDEASSLAVPYSPTYCLAGQVLPKCHFLQDVTHQVKYLNAVSQDVLEDPTCPGVLGLLAAGAVGALAIPHRSSWSFPRTKGARLSYNHSNMDSTCQSLHSSCSSRSDRAHLP